jgi:hypothetical protein
MSEPSASDSPDLQGFPAAGFFMFQKQHFAPFTSLDPHALNGNEHWGGGGVIEAIIIAAAGITPIQIAILAQFIAGPFNGGSRSADHLHNQFVGREAFSIIGIQAINQRIEYSLGLGIEALIE